MSTSSTRIMLASGLVFFAALSNQALAVTELPNFTLLGLNSLARLTSPVISPDGKTLAVVVSRTDYDENRVNGTVVLVDVATGTQRIVAEDRVNGLAWSPDGSRLAWMSMGRIIVTSALTTGATPIAVAEPTKIRGAAQSLRWSPDGKSIAFLATAVPVRRAANPSFDRWFEVTDHDQSSRATSAENEPTQLWLTAADKDTARALTSTDESVQGFDWAPSGQALVYNSQPGPRLLSGRLASLRSITVQGGGRKIIVKAPVGISGDPVVSATGQIAYRTYEGRDPWTHNTNVAVVTGRNPKILTSTIDRNIDGVAWLPDGKSVLVWAADHTRRSLWTQNVKGKSVKLNLGSVSPVSDVTVSANGDVGFIGTDANQPDELYVMTSMSGAPRRLTNFNDPVAKLHLGRVEKVSWNSELWDHDGTLTYPPNFVEGRKYPLMVLVHGGPELPVFERFNVEAQLMAARDWLVFQPNYRGSSGQGEQYQSAIIRDLAAGPGRDIMAGVAALSRRAIVDEKRVAVTGYSYGGFLSAWLITQQNFCAAVPSEFLVSWADYYNTSDAALWLDEIGGNPWLPENKKVYADSSIDARISDIRTPTLLLHNASDPNGSVDQAYKMFHGLRSTGVEAKLVIYDVASHNPGDPQQQRDRLRRTADWIDKHCLAR